MPNVGAVIREEITRLSRRESRSQIETTKKATVQQRNEIATLKRQYADLARQVAFLNRKFLVSTPAAGAKGSIANGKRVRFAAKGLRSQRERLALSQSSLGKLLGVSAQTVYNWERKDARPRAEQLAKIAALRTMGKREAMERLKQLSSGNGKVRGGKA